MNKIVPDAEQHILLIQALLECSFAGIALVSGPDLTFQLVNPTYQRLTPNPEQPVLGQPYHAVWPAGYQFPEEAVIQQVIASNQPLTIRQQERVYPSGEKRSFRINLCPIRWQGEAGVVLLIEENTAQAQEARNLAAEIVEETHRRAEELDAIITSIADVVIMFDARGVATRANPAAYEIFGIDPVGMEQAELIDLLSITLPDGQPARIAELPIARANKGENVVGERLLLKDKEGRERVFLVSATPLLSEAGSSGVVSVWHDVTTRERLLEQLEVQQSRLETIIQTAPEPILVTDEEGRLILCNPAAERIFNQPLPYHLDYHYLTSLNICYTTGEPYDPRNLPLVCSALDGSYHTNIELLILLPDGQRRNVLASTAPIVDRKGNLNGAVGVLKDITLRKRAEDELRTQASRSQILASLSRAFAEAGLNQRELLETTVNEIGLLSGDISVIELSTSDGKYSTLTAIHHPNPAILQAVRRRMADQYYEIRADSPAMTQVVRISDAIQPEEVNALLPAPYHLLLDYFPIRNGLVLPLRARGRWIGSLGILRDQPGRRFTMEDQFFFQDLADRAALAIENAHLYEQETRRVRELHALHQATRALLSTLDLETLLVQILDAAQQAIPLAEQSALYLLAPETGSLEVRASIGFRDPRIQKISSQAVRPFLTEALREKRPLLIHHLAPTANGAPRERDQIRSALIAPLVHSQEVLGVLSLTGSRPHLFQDADLRLLESFAATATTALHNATLYAEVQRLATTDPLTGLYNRYRFFELGEHEINRFRRFRNPLSAIMLDLDNFKEINDTFGHAVGDHVLSTVAARVRAHVRIVDILGRYGGDEFSILLPNADLTEAREIAERIRQAIVGEEIPTDRGPAPITISLGVAQADQQTTSLSALLARADAALYTAKQAGRNRVAES